MRPEALKGRTHRTKDQMDKRVERLSRGERLGYRYPSRAEDWRDVTQMIVRRPKRCDLKGDRRQIRYVAKLVRNSSAEWNSLILA